MSKSEPSLADALAQAHTVLMKDVGELETLARAQTGQTVTDLGISLAKLQQHLADHFRFEEQNGYMDAVLKRDPHQDRIIQHLQTDHRQLAQDLQELLREAGSSKSIAGGLGEKVLTWIHHLRAHEGRETRLVQEVFNVDAPAED